MVVQEFKNQLVDDMRKTAHENEWDDVPLLTDEEISMMNPMTTCELNECDPDIRLVDLPRIAIEQEAAELIREIEYYEYALSKEERSSVRTEIRSDLTQCRVRLAELQEIYEGMEDYGRRRIIIR